MTMIEDILQGIFESLESGEERLVIPIRSRRQHDRPAEGIAADREGDNAAVPNGRPSRIITHVAYPGRTEEEAKRFAAVLRILTLSHEALVSGTVITKRNIYYRHPELFRRQDVVDELVDDLAFTLGLGRDALNITADGRGAVSGHIRLSMSDGSVMTCSSTDENGIGIPPLSRVREVALSNPCWVLVIEKEATYRTLAASQYSRESAAGPGLLVTGKGYPDIATRAMLNLIYSNCPFLPIYVLVDYDPHGIRILRTYKFGSRQLDHEANITIPSIRWLGIRSSDVVQRPEQDDYPTSAFQHLSDHAAPLTARDRRAATKTLEAIHAQGMHDVDLTEQFSELQTMLMLNLKAEIQFVDNYGDLARWLDGKLCV